MSENWNKFGQKLNLHNQPLSWYQSYTDHQTRSYRDKLLKKNIKSNICVGKETILVGDFNAYSNKSSSLVENICDLGLNQMVDEGEITRPHSKSASQSGSLIDQIYANAPQNIIETVMACNAASDL